MKLFTIVLSLVTLATSTLAIASSVEVKAVGTLNFSTLSLGVSNSALESISRFGFGVLASLDVVPLSLETGLLFTPVGIGSGSQSLWTNYLQIPLLATYKAHIFSAGLGPYLGLGVGSGTNIANVTSKNLRTDFGLMAKAGVNVPVAPLVGLVGEAAYQFGLTNISNGMVTANARNFMILAGVSSGF